MLGLFWKQRILTACPISSQPIQETRSVRIFSRVMPCRGSLGAGEVIGCASAFHRAGTQAFDKEFHGEKEHQDQWDVGNKEGCHGFTLLLDVFTVEINQPNAEGKEFLVRHEGEKHEEVVLLPDKKRMKSVPMMEPLIRITIVTICWKREATSSRAKEIKPCGICWPIWRLRLRPERMGCPFYSAGIKYTLELIPILARDCGELRVCAFFCMWFKGCFSFQPYCP